MARIKLQKSYNQIVYLLNLSTERDLTCPICINQLIQQVCYNYYCYCCCLLLLLSLLFIVLVVIVVVYSGQYYLVVTVYVMTVLIL